jgi:DNA-binding cell septation regulator SpoVG
MEEPYDMRLPIVFGNSVKLRWVDGEDALDALVDATWFVVLGIEVFDAEAGVFV